MKTATTLILNILVCISISQAIYGRQDYKRNTCLSETRTIMSSNQVCGIEDDEKPTCERESCITNGDSGYGFYLTKDDDGNEYYEINTSISLLDLPFEGMCFSGDVREVTKIVQALAANTNKAYYDGGSSKIEDLIGISLTENSIGIEVKIFSGVDLESFSDYLVIKRCGS